MHYALPSSLSVEGMHMNRLISYINLFFHSAFRHVSIPIPPRQVSGTGEAAQASSGPSGPFPPQWRSHCVETQLAGGHQPSGTAELVWSHDQLSLLSVSTEHQQ